MCTARAGRQHGGVGGGARAAPAGGVGGRLAGAARQAHAPHAARQPAQARPTGTLANTRQHTDNTYTYITFFYITMLGNKRTVH